MPRITLKELKEKLDNLETQLNSGELQQKKQECLGFASEIEGLKNTATANNQLLETQKNSAETTKQAIEVLMPEIEAKKIEISNLLEETKKLNEESESLNDESRKQLGIVNAESLANAFSTMANKHETSFKQWFWWVLGSSVILLISVLGIVYWQFERVGSLNDLGFLTKLAILIPLVIFLSFSMRQYSTDRKLYDEYSFKSAVARSFEAYRKIIREEKLNDPTHDSKILEFVISSISAVYSSPTTAIGSKTDKGSVGIKEVSIIQQILGMFKGK